jgi:hypothetical protein
VWYIEDEHVERVENSRENDVAGIMFVAINRGKNVTPAKTQGLNFVYFKNQKNATKK